MPEKEIFQKSLMRTTSWRGSPQADDDDYESCDVKSWLFLRTLTKGIQVNGTRTRQARVRLKGVKVYVTAVKGIVVRRWNFDEHRKARRLSKSDYIDLTYSFATRPLIIYNTFFSNMSYSLSLFRTAKENSTRFFSMRYIHGTLKWTYSGS